MGSSACLLDNVGLRYPKSTWNTVSFGGRRRICVYEAEGLKTQIHMERCMFGGEGGMCVRKDEGLTYSKSMWNTVHVWRWRSLCVCEKTVSSIQNLWGAMCMCGD